MASLSPLCTQMCEDVGSGSRIAESIFQESGNPSSRPFFSDLSLTLYLADTHTDQLASLSLRLLECQVRPAPPHRSDKDRPCDTSSQMSCTRARYSCSLLLRVTTETDGVIDTVL